MAERAVGERDRVVGEEDLFLKRLGEVTVDGEDDQGVLSVITSHLSEHQEASDQWLRHHDYLPVLSLDTKKLIKQKEAADEQQKEDARIESLENEVRNKNRSKRELRRGIEELRVQQKESLKYLNLLQSLSLDLNDMEGQMTSLMADEGLPYEDFVEAILWRKLREQSMEE